MSDPAVLRVFIAVEIPAHLRGQLAALIARLRQAVPQPAARWVRPEGIHLTLKFLGDTPAGRAADLAAMLDEAVRGCAPFECVVGGLGCFPNEQRPRVLWAGVRDPAGALEPLQRAVEAGAARLGFAPEPPGRGFNPHLTLARAGRNARPGEARQLGQAAQTAGVGDIGPLAVDAVSLMRSERKPGGAVYTRLHQAGLGGPARGS